LSFPHVRGGVSVAQQSRLLSLMFSPRAWGCFLIFLAFYLCIAVFPTCVGVFLTAAAFSSSLKGFPHVRGGVSDSKNHHLLTSKFSPRAWGCFLLSARQPRASRVFPTCVGVFLFFHFLYLTFYSFPHVRGGVSTIHICSKFCTKFSPRAWGCFLL